MALATVGDIILGASSSADVRQFSKSSVTVNTGFFSSLFTAGTVPAAGSAPGTTAAVCTSATTGALSFNNATVGTTRIYEIGVCLIAAYRFLFLVDRLAHISGYSGTSTSAQNNAISVTSVSSARRGDSDYSEVMWFIEIYTAAGGTSTNITFNYTNGAGTSGQTVIQTFSNGLTGARKMVRILGNNNEPIQSIQSVTLSASTGTTGDFGITACRFVTPIFSPYASDGYTMNWMETRLAKVPDDACLYFVFYTPSAVTSGLIEGSITFIDR